MRLYESKRDCSPNKQSPFGEILCEGGIFNFLPLRGGGTAPVRGFNSHEIIIAANFL